MKKNNLDNIKNIPKATNFQDQKVKTEVDWFKINMIILTIILGITSAIVLILIIRIFA